VSEKNYAVTAWGKNKGDFHDLTCPSGQTCQVRRPGVEGLIELGLLDKVDALTGLVDQKHIARVDGRKAVDVEALAKDKKSLMQVVDTVNQIVVHVVNQPEIHPVPKKGQERDPEKVYVDDIDLEDKMFIFQYTVGGSSDLEKFREQPKQNAGSVATGKTVARKTKRVVRR